MSELDVIQDFYEKDRKEKIDKYRILNEAVVKGQILFTGSSLMEQFPINELLMTEKMDCIIYNRGVGGFTTDVNGNLKEEYTIEGVHMYANAYRCVLENLKQYLYVKEPSLSSKLERWLFHVNLHGT